MEILVTAKSNWRRWVGRRGKHKNPLPPIYEYAHDLYLAYSLFASPQDSISLRGCDYYYSGKTRQLGFLKNKNLDVRCQFDLDVEWEDTPTRRIEVWVDGQYFKWELDRIENDMAYGQLAQAFIHGKVHPFQVTVRKWFQCYGCVELI
jgi:hypothetical protein